MKRLVVSILLTAVICIVASLLTERRAGAQSSGRLTPILVELFTSEGCSSCPPADALLEQLDRSQPVAGAELIVLSEHVDYWNHIGWEDPYSSRFYSDRQNSYAQHFRSDSVYTPQMVVDGSNQFVGSDARAADWAFAQAVKAPKTGVRLSGVSIDAGKSIRVHVETDTLDASQARNDVEVYLAIALRHAESKVSGGENAGRRLTHTGVVRSMVKIGRLEPGQSFVQDVQAKLERGVDPGNLRLIAFIQESGTARVMGATMLSVDK